MFTRWFYHHFLTITFTMLMMASSHAGVVDVRNFGETTGSSNENNFGMRTKNQFDLKATFDYRQLNNSRSNPLVLVKGFGNSPSFYMGDLIYSSKNNRTNLKLGYPSINLLDDTYSGIDYFSYSGKNSTQKKLFSHHDNWRGKTASSSHSWPTANTSNHSTVQNTPDIPEPGPLLLAAMGMFGAWATSRRRENLN